MIPSLDGWIPVLQVEGTSDGYGKGMDYYITHWIDLREHLHRKPWFSPLNKTKYGGFRF